MHRIADYRLQPHAVEALRELLRAEFRLAIVTNQSGIGRGYFAQTDFERFQSHLLADLDSQGIHVDATYHCPHTPSDACACRKPGIALLERAQRELGANLEQSWVIGDAACDVELAQAAGCRSVLLVGADPPSEKLSALRPTFRAHDLPEAARLITAQRER